MIDCQINFVVSSFPSRISGDPRANIALSRALAFLLTARHLPPNDVARTPSAAGPSSSSRAPPDHFRTPDHPFSLFEGLAGTICAWADACAVIRNRLRKDILEASGVDSDTTAQPHSRRVLGIPGMGGYRVHGAL